MRTSLISVPKWPGPTRISDRQDPLLQGRAYTQLHEMLLAVASAVHKCAAAAGCGTGARFGRAAGGNAGRVERDYGCKTGGSGISDAHLGERRKRGSDRSDGDLAAR